MVRRTAGAALAIMLSTTGILLAQSGPAAAASQVCSGTSCVDILQTTPSVVAARGDRVELGYSIVVNGASAHLTAVSAHQSAGLAPDPTSVAIDGAAVPTTAVTVAGNDLSVDPSSLNPIGTGTHSFTFEVTMSSSANDDQTSIASTTFDDGLGGGSATATSDQSQITLDRPDFSLSDAQTTLSPLVAGGTANASLRVAGPGNAAATLALTASAGFTVVSISTGDNSAPPPCTRSGATLTCTGEFRDDLFNILVRADSGDRIGTAGTISAVVTPVGIGDANPQNNTASVPLVVQGKVALSITFSTPNGTKTVGNHLQTADLPVGRPTTVTITLTNEGPADATGVRAGFNLAARPAAYGVTFGPGLVGHPAGANSFAYGNWPIGSLAVGATRSVTVSITPKATGVTAYLGFYLFSDQLNTLQCDADGRACNDSASLAITAVPAAAAAAPSAAAGGSSAPTLAATGGPVRPALWVGLATVLSGAALTLLGRRRRSA